MISQHTKKTIEEFGKNFYHEESSITHLPCESLLNNENGKCNCQISDIKKWLSTKLEEAQKNGREEEIKTLLTNFVMCEKCIKKFKDKYHTADANLSKTEGEGV